MLRAFLCARLLLSFAVPASASGLSVEDQELAAAVRQLDAGDWSARMRTVHELEYMSDAGIPALAVAAVDGDWQVRMAAVHALGPLGPKATSILKYILKNEPCPVVRLIALHNLGSQAAEGAEAQAIDWMFSASSAEVNACRDQPAPGRAAWAGRLDIRVPKIQAVPAAHAAPMARSRPAPENPDSLPESHELVITPDVPKAAAAPPAAVHASPVPTKDERYAELDALLAEPAGPPETLGAAPRSGPRPSTPPAAAVSAMSPGPRTVESAELTRRRTAGAESLPRPVVTTAAPERPVAAPAAFEAAGSKAPHDAVPDLILALKSVDAETRSRAADELGYSGAAAAAAVPALMAVLKDTNPRVRASASLALGNIGAARSGVVPLLVKALKDRNLDVRYAAALALSRIGTPEGRAAFKKHIGEDARRAIEKRP